MRSDSLGDRALAWRRAHDLTQRDVAERAGLSPSTVHQVENRELTPTVTTAEKLAEGLGCDASWLILGEKVRKDPEGTIAERLRAKRAEKGLTTRGLSDLTKADGSRGVSHVSINEIERGVIRDPGVITVDVLARALGVETCWLAYGQGNP